jgi:hypothetical protein
MIQSRLLPTDAGSFLWQGNLGEDQSSICPKPSSLIRTGAVEYLAPCKRIDHADNIAKQLALAVLCCGLLAPVQAGEESRDKGRSGLDDLSHEMCTCAAYFSLLSSIVENSARSEMRRGAAGRIKSIGQAMLSQGINVARSIGVDEEVATKRVQVALKEMVETINSDAANSLKVMHSKYGLPCDALLQKAPQRFIALLKQYEAD